MPDEYIVELEKMHREYQECLNSDAPDAKVLDDLETDYMTICWANRGKLRMLPVNRGARNLRAINGEAIHRFKNAGLFEDFDQELFMDIADLVRERKLLERAWEGDYLDVFTREIWKCFARAKNATDRIFREQNRAVSIEKDEEGHMINEPLAPECDSPLYQVLERESWNLISQHALEYSTIMQQADVGNTLEQCNRTVYAWARNRFDGQNYPVRLLREKYGQWLLGDLPNRFLRIDSYIIDQLSGAGYPNVECLQDLELSPDFLREAFEEDDLDKVNA